MSIASISDGNATMYTKTQQALNLPSVATYNMRSVFPKILNLKNDLLERAIDCAFLVEIWEKSEKKQHQYEIEKMLEFDGLKYISTARPGGWGGVALVVNQHRFSLEKLSIVVPEKLEVIWGLLRPKNQEAFFKKILVCSFYSPPKSRKNLKLTDHLITTLQSLRTKYPDTPMILGADKNSMNIQPLLNCGLKLKQVVDLPTRQGKTLSILLMNTPQFYNSPVIIPPVPCDDPSSGGVPSDHSVPVSYPHTDRHKPPLRRYRTVQCRPLPEAGVNKFGSWITSEPFNSVNMNLDLDPSEHSRILENTLLSKLDEYCPSKSVKISSQDKPFMNHDLKKLHRRKQREYLKNGKSSKYDALTSQFQTKYRAAAEKYLRNKIDDLKLTKPGKAFQILKNLGAQPGDCTDGQTFTLPSHQSDNLTDQQCADRIAEHFASISGEYQRLDKELLPSRVKRRLLEHSTPPTISEYDCYKQIVKTNKPRSVVPGDLPGEIIKEFSVELASPLHKLYNNIVQSGNWPQQWKTEYVTPIAKIPQPEDEDDLRPISLTSFFSKVLEQFVVKWLLEVLGDKLDFRQYGGIKGNSVSHYLIELVNFILHSQDRSEPTAVLLCLVDFSKAFNRQDHHILITKLSDLGAPAWLLKLVMAFLRNRKMIVKYKGKSSKVKDLPGGGPQGTLLGLLLFIILINDLGFEGQTEDLGEIITSKKHLRTLNEIHLKYVDDLSLAEAVELNTLQDIPVSSRPQPDQYHARTGHILKPEDSRVYNQLIKTQKYAVQNGMKINPKKTKLILFNPSKKIDFMPKFPFNEENIEIVEKTKLLGLVISSDMSWASNTENMVTRCNKKLWMLRRLKRLGASVEDLLDVYSKQIRSILEYAVPVWHSAITGQQRLELERVQKSTFSIILGDQYRSYTSALKQLNMDTLQARRVKLCKKFAKKASKSTKFSQWFKIKNNSFNTRQNKKYCQVFSRTVRYEKSPIPYLTNILNSIK